MYRVLLRIGVLSAAVIMGATALAAANNTEATLRTVAAGQNSSDPSTCLLIKGVWYCFDDFESDQDSRGPASSNP